MRVIVPQGRYARVFDEVAETIRYGLEGLAATGFKLPDRRIVIGPHLLARADAQPDDVFYNFEQRESPQLNTTVLESFRKHEVWDYSPTNVEWLAARGVRAKHVPLGYVPAQCRIEPAVTQDIDVLFYGLVNNRRRNILEGLRVAGLNVVELYECYGEERDQYISRSKVVLNVHFYDTRIFEIVRCAYLFSNAICVISEESEDVPAEIEKSVRFVPYGQLIGDCVHAVQDPFWRRALATHANESFRACNEIRNLRRALYDD